MDKEQNKLVKYVITKFIKKDSINWKRDTIVGQRLIKEFPDPKFWEFLETKEQFFAMPQLLTPYCRGYIEEQYKMYLFKMPQKDNSIQLNANKSAEIVSEKPKLLKDFLGL
jgi:hypothetical protein